ncbi:MAG: hypothetical protein VW378_03190 [bacterium]
MKKEKGSVLVMTLFAIALLSILITGIMVVLSSEIHIASQDAWARQAGFVAETAIAESMYQLTLNDNWNTGFTNEPFGTDQQYSALIINKNPLVTIHASGTAHGVTRQIEASLVIIDKTTTGKFALRVDSWEEL